MVKTYLYYFGVWNIHYLLLCLIDNYHQCKQSSQFVTPEANIGRTPSAHAKQKHMVLDVELRFSQLSTLLSSLIASA